ncbi:putative phosphatidylinositol 3-5-bisphosphate-binding protein [Venturia nashicola]|uniref:Putative phosphatidylinositol 3-5-bisphosphate-binding protein n=1 Tax=Venturia nashicola TaxID=86259 RepID=A0A4Z1PLY9_9PEZI|nr:putative phosphatidylinositol 3-5-bisphosphate-binding protein [Venturia nashicola]
MDIRAPFYTEAPSIALGIEFNEDGTSFTVATDTGFKIYDTANGKLTYDRELQGSISYASVLSKSRLVGLIGGGICPHYPPNKFVLWDDSSKSEPFKIEYNNTPIRACLTKSRYVVVFERGVILYKLEPDSEHNDHGSRIAVYETAPNPFGLCCLGETKLAFPGRTKGQVQVVDVATRRVSILPAHKSPLRALALSKDETMVATASDTGTLIRVWSTAREARLFEFRRGLENSAVFSISFSPSGALMATTSDKSTLHIFEIFRVEKKDDKTKRHSSSKPVTVPSRRRPLSGMSQASGSPSSPSYGVSPSMGSSAGKKKIGTSPSDRTSVTPSDFSFTPSSSNRAEPNWNDLARQQPQPSLRRPSLHSDESLSPEMITSSDLEGYAPGQRYTNFTSYIPTVLTPKLATDTYSICKCPFEMGNEPISFFKRNNNTSNKAKISSEERASSSDAASSVSSIRSGSTIRASESVRPSAWWPGGRPPKGKIAWIDDNRLVVVGGGADARWETFIIGTTAKGDRGIERRGWRRILEDEGVD